jgi:hypothetical protein
MEPDSICVDGPFAYVSDVGADRVQASESKIPSDDFPPNLPANLGESK